MAQVPTTSRILDSDLTPEWTAGSDRPDFHEFFAAIKGNTFDGERIDGMYRGCSDEGVQVLAITSRRLMMVEPTSWDGRLALTSVPYARVTSVGFLSDEQGLLVGSSAIGIRMQSVRFELVCESEELAREAHDLISWSLVAD